MSGRLPHLVGRLLLVALVPLAACEPSWKGSAPVTKGVASAQGGCGATVTAYGGDTVYSIARRCNVSVRELIEANNLAAPYTVSPGMVLRLPGGSGEYVVQRGDTLLVVARRLGVDFQSLAKVNGKSAPYTIFLGEKLKVPGSYSQTAAQAAPANTASALVIPSPNSPNAGRTAPTKQVAVKPAPLPPAPAIQPEPEARHAAFQPQQSLPPPPPPPMAGKGFIWPVKGEVVTEFGPMAKGQNNDGINIAAPRGTAIKAAENGVVAYAGNELKGFGNLLLVKHADGWMSAYAHADQLMVKKGDQVRKGQQIATVGSSGGVSAPQLHFELRRGTEAVNPMDHLRDALSALPSIGDEG